jgi:MFS family permease
MLVADALRIPLMLSIPLLYGAGMLSFGLLLVLVFLLGVFIAPYFSAQRIVLPELVGEDSAVLTQANAVVEAGTRLTMLLGPVLAGVLIAWIGAVNVLYVDAATFAVSFLLLAVFVPKRPPLPRTDDGRGLFAGLRFVFDDALLKPMLLTIIGLHVFAQTIFISLPVLAYDHYGADARTAGLLFGAWGAGSVIGALAAIPLARRMAPLTQATLGVVWVSAPLVLLGLELPAVGAMGVLFAAGLGAVAAAPMMAIFTTRAPEELRPKVMTAVITLITISGPIALLAVGRLLESYDVRTILLGLAIARIAMAIVFVLVVRRIDPPVRQQPGEAVA